MDMDLESLHGQEVYLFTKTPRLSLGHTQPPQWVLMVKRVRLEADYSSRSKVKVKNKWRYTVPVLPL
jgi:hypothetical protein